MEGYLLSALVIAFLLGVITVIKIENAMQAAHIRYQEQQIAMLSTQQAQRSGCGGTILLATFIICLVLILMVSIVASAPPMLP